MRTTGDRWHEESERNLVRDGVAVGVALAISLAAYTAIGCTACYAADDLCTEGLTQEGGINWYDGRLETYYSSNVLRHYMTDEWILDEEGFYRDQDGRYVVAASDMEYGTVLMGSKGECVVLDCGCDDGVTDYYVAW